MAIFSMSIAFSLGVLGVFAPGPNNPDYSALIILILAAILICFLFFSIRLSFTLNKAGIYYRYFPFHLREYFIPWENVISAEGRKYKPLSEYGGWGIKGRKKNRAFNISGSFGLQLELIDGRKILFESNNSEGLENALKAFRPFFSSQNRIRS